MSCVPRSKHFAASAPTETLYALVRCLCKMSHAVYVDDEPVAEVVDALNEVGGPSALREAADRVAREASQPDTEEIGTGLATVGACSCRV